MSDHVRYPSFSFHEAHPDRLSGLAALWGLTAPDVSTCRVLGLGCASAGHLIPMAHRLPKATFVGIDFAPEEIALGQKISRELALENLELITANLADLTQWQGPFDYIIAHGLYSWLPADLQPVLLDGLRKALSPQGVAFVSWNTQPGWSKRAPVHELIKCFVDTDAPPTERVRQGRAFATLLAAHTPKNDSTYSRMVHEELDNLSQAHDGFFLGDVAVGHMVPLRYDQFDQRVSEAGLQILCDAGGLNPAITGPTHPQVRAAIEQFGDDLTKVESFLDAITGRAFRTSLLVRDDVALTGVSPQGFASVQYSTDLAPPHGYRPGEATTFSSPWGGQARIDMPILQLLLDAMSQHHPRRLGHAALLQAVEVLIEGPLPDAVVQQINLGLRMCVGTDLVQVHTRDLAPRPEVSDTPTVCPVVRVLARNDALRVPTDTHRALPLTDTDRTLLPLLDGSRTGQEAADQLGIDIADVRARLLTYGQAGLFTA